MFPEIIGINLDLIKLHLKMCSDFSYNGRVTIITYDQLIELNRSELRDRMKGKQVVYIYHNEIDAKGDHAATEKEVFSAVENTFTQLDTILRILKHSLSV
jgi:hypothetical protein